jgi:ABC-type phosphate/phosphonate transport system substrate-binding protein
MRNSVRFAVPSERAVAEPAVLELRVAVEDAGDLELAPVYLSSYAALLRAAEIDPSLVAWVPPLIAQDLFRARVATPVVAVGRGGATSYFSAIVVGAHAGAVGLGDLRGARMGWVSKLSAAGYVVPRRYLESLGVDPETTFRSEAFFGSHERAADALVSGEVDAVATHARLAPSRRTLLLLDALHRARIVAVAGPIPGDVVVAGVGLDVLLRERLKRALLACNVRPDGALARLMNVTRFEPATAAHFEWLSRWSNDRSSSAPVHYPPPADLASAG